MRSLTKKECEWLLGGQSPEEESFEFAGMLNQAPEADLLAVAGHDFSGLAWPLLVACRDQEQFEEFTFREGLICSEVRRLGGRTGNVEPFAARYPENKILLLLPGWQDHDPTRQLVEWWVNDLDRYTVQLRTPLPLIQRKRRMSLYTLAVVGWFVALFAWLIFR